MLIVEPSDTLASRLIITRGIFRSLAVIMATPMPLVSTVTTMSASTAAKRLAKTLAESVTKPGSDIRSVV